MKKVFKCGARHKRPGNLKAAEKINSFFLTAEISPEKKTYRSRKKSAEAENDLTGGVSVEEIKTEISEVENNELY